MMIYAVDYKNGEQSLPVYYEYDGSQFTDDLTRAFARAEEAGLSCRLSEIPESLLSEYGIAYVKPVMRVEMKDGFAVRDPWEGTGLSPCSCADCSQCALSKGNQSYCMRELETVSHACGAFDAPDVPHDKLRFRGEPLFSFRSEGVLAVSPIRIAKMFAKVSEEIRAVLARQDFTASDLDVVDGATEAPSAFFIHGKGYFFPYGRALIDLGFYPGHPELSLMDQEVYEAAMRLYEQYGRIAIAADSEESGEVVTDPKILSELEKAGYFVRK